MINFDQKRFLLAPMANFTNAACRSIFVEYGADAVVSEFVYSRAVLSGAVRVMEKLKIPEGCRPAGIQIFGSNENEMADAAVVVEEKFAPDFIDINFGCPAPNAVCAGAGAALLKDVRQVARIVEAVSKRVSVAVTAKMRIGWDSSSIVVPDAARRLEDAGAKMITLHGRTKAQGYDGAADWNLIEQTARAVSVPLVGNGSAELLDGDFMRNSACAGFMIGRAALGNPWIFGRMKARLRGEDESAFEPTPQQRASMALRYAKAMAGGGFQNISSDNIKFIQVQVMRFLKNAEGFKRLRTSLKDVKTLGELENLLCEYL